MKHRCVILDDYQQVALQMADWSSLGIEVKSIERHLDQESDLIEALFNFQIVVIMRERTPFSAHLLSRLPNLKLLVTSGMRNAAIDLNAASSGGVTVCGTASSSEPPAELTWALILALARNIVEENASFRRGGAWQSSVGMDLNGKTLGLLGFGKIGGRVAKVALAFGMKVIAWSQNLTQERADAGGVQLAHSKDELLEAADFVSIHLVLSQRTRHLIGFEEINRMRPSAYLINTSRADIVDQTALVSALLDKRIAGAGLDVFDTEPLPGNHVLRTLPNILATPHLGYVSKRNYETYFKEAIDDIKRFLEGSPVRKLS